MRTKLRWPGLWMASLMMLFMVTVLAAPHAHGWGWEPCCTCECTGFGAQPGAIPVADASECTIEACDAHCKDSCNDSGASGATYVPIGWVQSCSGGCLVRGACCNPDTGGCSETEEYACAAPSIWTAGVDCNPNPCPQPYEYQTRADGDWNCVTIGSEVWERRASGSSGDWETVTESVNLPNYEDGSITVRHNVTVTEAVTIDQTTVNADKTLTVNGGVSSPWPTEREQTLRSTDPWTWTVERWRFQEMQRWPMVHLQRSSIRTPQPKPPQPPNSLPRAAPPTLKSTIQTASPWAEQQPFPGT